MKIKYLSVFLFFMTVGGYGQVGIGTKTPNEATLLHIENDDASKLKGILIPKVSLDNLKSFTSFATDELPNGLLIYHEGKDKNAIIKEGFYYWTEGRWNHIGSDEVNDFRVVETGGLGQSEGEKYNNKQVRITTSSGTFFDIPLRDLNIVTNLISEGEGRYVYTNELGLQQGFNVVEDVIQNIETITKNEVVKNEVVNIVKNDEVTNHIVNNILTEKTEDLIGDGIIAVENGSKSVLKAVTLRVNDKSIGIEKLKATSEEAGKVAVVGGDGSVQYSDNLAKIVSIGLDESGSDMVITDTGGNSYEIPLSDLNLLSTLIHKGKGIYQYTNEAGGSTLIDIPQDVINNFEEIITNEAVINQINSALVENIQHVTNEIAKQGKELKSDSDNIFTVTGGGTAVLNPVVLGVNDRSIGVEKLKAGVNDANKIVSVGADGTVSYKINDAKITSLGVSDDRKNLVITDAGGKAYTVALSAINIVSTMVDKGAGVFEYTDEAGTMVKIDVPNEVINNIDEIIQSTQVVNEIKQVIIDNATSITNVVANEGKEFKGDADGIINVRGGSKAVLNPVDLVVNNRSIGVTKLKAELSDAGKFMSVDATGQVALVPLTLDEKSIVQFDVQQEDESLEPTDRSSRLTIVTKDQEVFSVPLEDLNILTSLNKLQKSGKDLYVYTNEAGEQFIVDITENVINNIEEIFESQKVQEYLHTKGDKVTAYVRENSADLVSSDKTIVIGGDAKGLKTVFAEVDLGLADNAVQSKHIRRSAVTVDKLSSKVGPINMATNQVFSATGSGEVAFNDVNTLIKKGTLSGDGAFTISGGENALLKDVTIELEPGGIQTEHLKDQSVTVDKISSNGASGQLLQSNRSGGAVFIDSAVVFGNHMNGNLVGEDGTITITNAEERVFGTSEVGISVAQGGIKTVHLANSAVTSDKIAGEAVTSAKIAPNAVTADKLWAGSANDPSRVALADDTGKVSFTALSSDHITPTGELKGDEIIGVTAVSGSKVLFDDATLSINSKSIGVDKLSSVVNKDNVAVEHILVSDGSGGVKFSSIDKITADGEDLISDVLEFSDGTSGGIVSGIREGAVLEKTKVGIKDKSIDVTKLSSLGSENNMLLVSDGNGGFGFTTMEAVQSDSENLYLEDGLVFNDEQKGKKVVFIETKIGIGDKGIQGTKIADQAITADKLFADTSVSAAARVPLATADGIVTYQPLKSSLLNEGESLTTDGVITVSSVDNQALLSPITLGIKEEGIQNKHIAEGTITFSKINAEQATPGSFVVVDDSSSLITVSSQTLVQTLGKDLTLGSALSFVNGNGKNAVLNAVGVDIKPGGITSDKIANQAVLPSKINSSESSQGELLVANGLGGTVFKEAKEIVQGQLTSSIAGDATIVVTNGENVLSSDTNVTLGLKEGSISNKYIQENTVTSDKLTAGVGVANRVAVADSDGEVTYTVLDSSHLTSSGDLSVNEGLSLTGNGAGALFSNITLGVVDFGITERKIGNGAVTKDKIAEKSIEASKMVTNHVEDGKFLQAKDGAAQYVALTINNIAGGEDLTTDNSLSVNAGVGSLLTKAQLRVNEGGIKREHVALKQISSDKLSSEIFTSPNQIAFEPANKVLTSDGGGGVVYRVPIDLIDDYDLTSSGNSIIITNGNNAVLADVNIDVQQRGISNNHLQDNIVDHRVLGNQAVKSINIDQNAIQTSAINNGAVTTAKLSSRGQDNINAGTNTVLTADGNGNATYKSVESLLTKGDLGVGSALVVQSGDGAKSVFNDVTIDVKAEGITGKYIAAESVTSDKIAQGAVSIDKLSTKIEDTNKVLVGNDNGGAAFENIEKVLPKTPQFFFLPSVNLDVSAKGRQITKDLYQEYVSQFGRPQVVSPGAPGLELKNKDSFYYYITYYDTKVFEKVSVSSEGVLTYAIKNDAVFTSSTYMNIVLQVK